MARILAFCKSPYVFCILFILLLGILNLKIQCGPAYAEWTREKRAVSTFDKYWKTEGAESFRKVGVEPTKKIYEEELADYLKRFHTKNPTLVPEKRIAEMKEDFRTWWETSGKKSYAINKISPDEKLYRSELKRYIQSYTKNVPVYQISYIPNDSNVTALFTCWLLFPSLLSFILFATGFLIAMKALEKRWGLLQSALFFATATLLGEFIFAGTLSFSYFERYGDSPFMGMSLSLAFLLSIASFGPKHLVPKSVPFISILLLVADVLVNWNGNPNLYGWIAILEIFFFGAGAFVGNKVPRFIERHREKKSRLVNISEAPSKIDPRIKTRERLKDALDLANKAEYDHASQILISTFGQLFHEHPLDTATIEKTVDGMLYSHYFFTILGMQWMAWGSDAERKGLSKTALALYEKGIATEKDEKIRRRGLFYAGDLRIRTLLDAQKGREELEEVVRLNETDILASEARKILGK